MTYQVFEILMLTIFVGIFWRYGFIELIRQLYETKLTSYRSDLIDFAWKDSKRIETPQYQFTIQKINTLIDKSSRVGLLRLIIVTYIILKLRGKDKQDMYNDLEPPKTPDLSSEENSYYIELQKKTDNLGLMYFTLTNPFTLLLYIMVILYRIILFPFVVCRYIIAEYLKNSNIGDNNVEVKRPKIESPIGHFHYGNRMSILSAYKLNQLNHFNNKLINLR